VEIAGAISTDPNILILDEPTSALSESEIEKLFETIHLLKEKHDVGIVYISHRLQEVQQIADYLTVIRDGKIVADGGIGQFSQEEIVHFIVGEKVIANKRGSKNAGKEKVLEVKNLTRAGEFRDISFDLYEGEILGIAGLVGSKRTELIKALFGITCADSGKVIVNGKEISRPCPDKMIQLGMAYAPEDRKNEGIILDLSVNSNLSVANLKNITRLGMINHRKEKKLNSEQIRKYDIKTAGLDVKINSLSGGNQQKVVISKMLVRNPHIILLDEPTRGIDVGAKLQIFELLRKLSAEKVSIIFISSEMEEVVDISDRILVMFNGKITEVIDSSEEVTVKEVVMKASCGN
jgi:ABC-type sugar transport system ATPase subunit